MRKAIISFGCVVIAISLTTSCKKKAQEPTAITVDSGSVTVDSVAPDSDLVIIEDTSVTVGIVPDGKKPEHKKSK